MAHRRYLAMLWKICTNHLCQSTQLCQLRILLTRMTGSTMLSWLLRLEPTYKLLVMICWLPTPRFVVWSNKTSPKKCLHSVGEPPKDFPLTFFFLHFVYTEGSESNRYQSMQCSSPQGTLILFIKFHVKSYLNWVDVYKNHIWHKSEMNRSIKLVLWPRVLKLLGCPKKLDGVSWPVTEGLHLFLNPTTVRSSVGLANHRTVADDSCEMCNKSYGCKIFNQLTEFYILILIFWLQWRNRGYLHCWPFCWFGNGILSLFN